MSTPQGKVVDPAKFIHWSVGAGEGLEVEDVAVGSVAAAEKSPSDIDLAAQILPPVSSASRFVPPCG